MSNATYLRELAESLRVGGAPVLPIVQAALGSPAPPGDPEGVRAVAQDFRQYARSLSEVSTDLDKVREERLPEVWSGGMDTAAAERRLRAAARHAEHASGVLDRVRPCLNTLARDLGSAQLRDAEARERIHDASLLGRAGAHEDTVRTRTAAEIDEMADAAEAAGEAAAGAARELRLLVREAGSMWLTRPRPTWHPSMPPGAIDDRMPPEEILLRYHHPDDPDGMVTFQKWYWPFQSQEMTAAEAEMLDDLSPEELRDAKEIRDDAWERVRERFPAGHHNNHGDAWRHAYWSARMAQRFGEEWSEDFATAHEGQHGNHPSQDSMDLYNNEVGRRIALENPDATPGELGDLIMQAIDNGEMLVIQDVDDRSELVYSDEVSHDELQED